MTSWKMEVVADNSGKYCDNALRFASQGEAEAYAQNLQSRWTLVTAWRVVQSDEPVNYAYKNGNLMRVPP